MGEDEKRLNELQKSMKQKDDPSFWELFQSIWHINLLIVKKQRTLNQLRWIAFQTKLEAFVLGCFVKDDHAALSPLSRLGGDISRLKVRFMKRSISSTLMGKFPGKSGSKPPQEGLETSLGRI